MTLTRYNRPGATYWTPFAGLPALRDELDRLFSVGTADWLADSPRVLSGWAPPVDLYEDKDFLVFKAELPGFKKENIEISLHDGVLTVSGERKVEDQSADTEAHRTERFYGKFQRSVSLPVAVDAEKIKASYEDGLLTVTLPKSEHAKPRQIAINA
jgi:HSP20 family protein